MMVHGSGVGLSMSTVNGVRWKKDNTPLNGSCTVAPDGS
jgi:hypothetical protein